MSAPSLSKRMVTLFRNIRAMCSETLQGTRSKDQHSRIIIKSQSSPMQVDGKVIGFQAINSGQALVLGSDVNLWLEARQTGTVPPPRTLLSANVRVTF